MSRTRHRLCRLAALLGLLAALSIIVPESRHALQADQLILVLLPVAVVVIVLRALLNRLLKRTLR